MSDPCIWCQGTGKHDLGEDGCYPCFDCKGTGEQNISDKIYFLADKLGVQVDQDCFAGMHGLLKDGRLVKARGGIGHGESILEMLQEYEREQSDEPVIVEGVEQ